jgi:predicted TPR repeat methyltransferase
MAKPLAGKIAALIHRVLLHIKPYRLLIVALGLDSRRYKSYYKKLHFHNTAGIALSDVDGYRDEGDYRNVVQLVNNLAQMIPPPGAVLDIGCGTGRYLKQMAAVWPGSHLEGIDISKEIVEKFTRQQLPHIPVHILDIETDTQFPAQNREKFDLVCMIGIIQILSLKKIHAILENVNRLCKECGYLYVQFNVETATKKSSVGYKRYDLTELSNLLAGHGFETLRSARTDILKDYAYILAGKPHGTKDR